MNVTAALILQSVIGVVSVDAPAPDMHSIELAIVKKTNAERARFGRAPLTIDRSLMQSARRHTAWMSNMGSLRHTNAPVAENIAAGQSSSDQVIQDWMNSPGHRANMLNPSYRRIGVAAYRAPNGQIYWCQQFLQ